MIKLLVLVYKAILGFNIFEAFPNVIAALLSIFVFSPIIPNSFAADVPFIVPLFVKVPPPFAKIPTIPPVVEVLFTRFILVLLVALALSYTIPIPLPFVLPEYLYSNVVFVRISEFFR